MFNRLLLLSLLSCGKPSDPVGSCVVELDASICVNIHDVDTTTPTLTKDSARYVCRNLLEGLYFETPCEDRERAGTCTLKAKDGVQFEYVLYAPRWTAASGKETCEYSEGLWE